MEKTCDGPDCDASVNERAIRLGDKLFCCKGCSTGWLLSQGIYVVEESPQTTALVRVNGNG